MLRSLCRRPKSTPSYVLKPEVWTRQTELCLASCVDGISRRAFCMRICCFVCFDTLHVSAALFTPIHHIQNHKRVAMLLPEIICAFSTLSLVLKYQVSGRLFSHLFVAARSHVLAKRRSGSSSPLPREHLYLCVEVTWSGVRVGTLGCDV